MKPVSPHLRIELDEADARFEGGARAGGRVVILGEPGPIYAETLDLSLTLHVRSVSAANLQIPFAEALLGRRISVALEATHEVPFALTLPLWPASFESEEFTLAWHLRATLQERRVASQSRDGRYLSSPIHQSSRTLTLTPPTIRVERPTDLVPSETAERGDATPLLDRLGDPTRLPAAESGSLDLEEGRLAWDMSALELTWTPQGEGSKVLASAESPIAVQLSRSTERSRRGPTLVQRLLRRRGVGSRHTLHAELRTQPRLRLSAETRSAGRLDGLAHLSQPGEDVSFDALVGLLTALRHLDCTVLGGERRARSQDPEAPSPEAGLVQELPLDTVQDRHELTALLERSDASENLVTQLQRSVDFYSSETDWYESLLSRALPMPRVPAATSPGQQIRCEGEIPFRRAGTLESVLWSLIAVYTEHSPDKGGITAFKRLAVLDERSDPDVLGEHEAGARVSTGCELELPSDVAPIPRLEHEETIWAVDWLVLLRAETSEGTAVGSARLNALPTRVRWALTPT